MRYIHHCRTLKVTGIIARTERATESMVAAIRIRRAREGGEQRRRGRDKGRCGRWLIGLRASVRTTVPPRRAKTGEKRRRDEKTRMASDTLAATKESHEKDMGRAQKVRLGKYDEVMMLSTRAGGLLLCLLRSIVK